MFGSLVDEGPFAGVSGEPWAPLDDAPTGLNEPAPGPGELPASGLAALELDWATQHPGAITDTDVVDGIVGFERVAAWAQARQARLLSEFLARRGDAFTQARPTEAARWAPDEIAVALNISRTTAMSRLYDARRLVTVLPQVLDAWAAGRLDGYKVRIIADAVHPLDPERAAAVAARVLPKAPQQSPSRLRAALARAIILVDPQGANARHRKARADRRVAVSEQPEGMASLWAYMSAPDARSCWEWLTRMARGLGKDDSRLMDTRRADLLVALLTGKLTHTDGADQADTGYTNLDRADPDRADPDPDRAEPADADRAEPGRTEPGRADSVDCADAGSADLGSAEPGSAEPGSAEPGSADGARTRSRHSGDAGGGLGAGSGGRSGGDPQRPAREQVRPVTPGKPLITVTIPYPTLTGAAELPGELAGYGPIPADLAREIAADAVWKRLLYDPLSGTVLDYGRTTYHPPAGLADHVRARDLHCRGPHCPRPASACELDHFVPYPQGPTSEDNLDAHCKKDHDLKHHAGWKVVQQPDGGLKWITPTGYSHTTYPHDYRPDPIDLDHGLPDPAPDPAPDPPPAPPDDDEPPF